MDQQETNTQPSFLGIQISNGDVIPIDVRYVGKDKVIFSLPAHNAKQPYSISGNIGEKMDVPGLKRTLEPFFVKFTAAEEINLRTANQPGASAAGTQVNQEANRGNMQNETQQMNIPNLDVNSTLTENIPQEKSTKTLKRTTTTKEKPSKKIKNPISDQTQNNSPELSSEFSDSYILEPNYQYEPFHNKNEYLEEPLVKFDFNTELDEINKKTVLAERYGAKKNYGEKLLLEGMQMYESDSSKPGVLEVSLQMMRQAQITLHEIFPESFSKIVLPGPNQELVHQIDPDAMMMSPLQFKCFMKRRLRLALLRAKGKIKPRTSGPLYPGKVQHAKNRARIKGGLFE